MTALCPCKYTLHDGHDTDGECRCHHIMIFKVQGSHQHLDYTLSALTVWHLTNKFQHHNISVFSEFVYPLTKESST